MFKGAPLPAIDLGRLTGRADSAGGAEVIVVRTRNEQRIGLLVDELADIPEIPVSAQRPMADVVLQTSTRILD